MQTTITEECYNIADGLVTPANDPTSPIVVYGVPTDEERHFLTTELQIDEHTLQSAMDPDEMARLEFEPTHAAIILKRAHRIADNEGEQEFRVSSLGAFLFQNKLIIIHTDDDPLFTGRRPGVRCESLRGALLEIIYHSIALFMRDVRLIHHLSQAIEEQIEFSLGNKALSSMFDLHKGLVYYQSALQSNQLLLNKMRMHADRISFSREERELLDDAMVDNEQCLKLVEMYSYILTGMSDARVSIIGNNLNVIMKKMTIISMVFLPLNVIASMFGMSEYTLFTESIPPLISYSAFTVGMFLLAYITWLFIRNIGVEEPAPRGRRKRHKPRKLPALLGGLLRH